MTRRRPNTPAAPDLALMRHQLRPADARAVMEMHRRQVEAQRPGLFPALLMIGVIVALALAVALLGMGLK